MMDFKESQKKERKEVHLVSLCILSQLISPLLCMKHQQIIEKSRKQVQALDATIEKVCNKCGITIILDTYFLGKSSIEWKTQKGRSASNYTCLGHCITVGWVSIPTPLCSRLSNPCSGLAISDYVYNSLPKQTSRSEDGVSLLRRGTITTGIYTHYNNFG